MSLEYNLLFLIVFINFHDISFVPWNQVSKELISKERTAPRFAIGVMQMYIVNANEAMQRIVNVE